MKNFYVYQVGELRWKEGLWIGFSSKYFSFIWWPDKRLPDIRIGRI